MDSIKGHIMPPGQAPPAEGPGWFDHVGHDGLAATVVVFRNPPTIARVGQPQVGEEHGGV